MDGASGREAELGHAAIASAAGSQQAVHHCEQVDLRDHIHRLVEPHFHKPGRQGFRWAGEQRTRHNILL